MQGLKEDLFNYDYWSSTKPELYNITSYDLALLEKGFISKQVAHCCLSKDISRLLVWTTDQNLEKILKQLKNSLAQSKKDAINVYFWNNTAPTFIKEKLDGLSFQSEIIDTSRKLISITSKRILEDTVKNNSSETLIKKLKTKEERDRKEKEKENDGVTVNGSKTLGTIIKNSALKYHEKLLQSHAITDSEYAAMATGLSSIMDFCQECCGSQKSLLKQEDWSRLFDVYKNKYATKLINIPDVVKETWAIIVKRVIDTRDIKIGLVYLYKIYPKHINKPYFYCFKIFEHILDLMEYYPKILIKGSNTTENDYIRLMWSNIFEHLFRPKNNVSIITGETVNPISTLNRKEQYNIKADTKKEKEKKIIGFKIDIRLNYNQNCQQHVCIDLCVGEVSKKEDKSKTITDQCKVVREAKDNLDVLLSVLPNSSSSCVGWSFLIAGSTCSISCLYLDANGLYVNIPKYNFSLPTNIAQLPQFIDSLQYLLTLRREILSLADKVQTELSKPPSIISSLGRPNNSLAFNPKIFWQRDTYYPPPTDMKSVTPKHLFGFPPTDSIIEKLNILSHKNNNLSNVSSDDETDVNRNETDAFGWRKEGAKWYNVYTKTYTATSPYDSDDTD